MTKLLGLAAAFASLAFCAGFWQKKKYTAWSEKETLRVITKSPWASVVNSGPRGGAPPPRPTGFDASNSGSPAGNASNGANGPPRGGGMRGGRGRFGGRTFVPSPAVTMRWHSAKPVQQAVANLRYGSESEGIGEPRNGIHPREHHVLGIYGLSVTAAQLRPEQLRRAVWIETRTGRVLRPVSVYLDRGQKDGPEPGVPGPRVGYTLYAFFDRGARAIRRDDREIEVVFRYGRSDYKKKFKLDQMMFDGNLEI
jgi:hypothetical protein